jgi:hypothetical protein
MGIGKLLSRDFVVKVSQRCGSRLSPKTVGGKYGQKSKYK